MIRNSNPAGPRLGSLQAGRQAGRQAGGRAGGRAGRQAGSNQTASLLFKKMEDKFIYIYVAYLTWAANMK